MMVVCCFVWGYGFWFAKRYVFFVTDYFTAHFDENATVGEQKFIQS